MRDARIEKLRSQQAIARNNTEYQAFLTEINTEKVDKGKAEDEQLKVMEQVEKLAAEIKTLQGQIGEETGKHQTTREQLAGKLAELQADIDNLRPVRDEASVGVSPKAREVFERLVERYEGEAMAPISRPKPKREEYVCTACNMELVVDLYNRLHTRDEIVFCPSCRRLLYIPDDLPPEMAVNKRKPQKDVKSEIGQDAAPQG
jgi:predicted  nucleic acid-binding Zn-ribbon protein